MIGSAAKRNSGMSQEEDTRWVTASTHKRVLDHTDVVEDLIEAVKRGPEMLAGTKSHHEPFCRCFSQYLEVFLNI